MPFLTAVATGEAADELQLDRCSGVSLSRGRAPAQSADLHLGELAILSSSGSGGVRGASGVVLPGPCVLSRTGLACWE